MVGYEVRPGAGGVMPSGWAPVKAYKARNKSGTAEMYSPLMPGTDLA